MRRFIAHIGAAKTGTTAFQIWLKTHRAEMMRAGYLVPEKTPRLGNHRPVVMALARTSERSNADAVRATTLEEFKEHPALDILVSTEALSSEEHLPGLLPALTAQFQDCERVAILAARDQIAHFNSLFAQQRKAMRRNERDFDAYLRSSLDQRQGDWRALTELYESHGWRVVVIPYNADAKARGITRTILSLPEFGDAASRLPVDEAGERNPSMGAIGLIIMDLIQDAVDPEGMLDTAAPAALRDRVAARANERFNDRPFNGFTKETCAQVLDRFAAPNQWIADRFFDVPWEVACPPQPPASRSPRQLSDLPEDVAARVARTAKRMTAYARELGGLERPAKSGRAAQD